LEGVRRRSGKELKEQSKSKSNGKSNRKSSDEESGARRWAWSEERNRLWRVLGCKVRMSSVLGMFRLMVS
jgi:hypothetical protein